MNDTKVKALEFLYNWTNRNVISQVKKGMVEDLEAFVLGIIAEEASKRSAIRMKANSEEEISKDTTTQEP